MDYPNQLVRCPKCDFERGAENLNRTLTVDVAHNRQTVMEAITQFETALENAVNHKYGYLRIIVGGAKIRDEIERNLSQKKELGTLATFGLEPKNNGCFLIKLRKTRT